MTSFYGTDNPYRAPKVARDVATFRGAFQEVARIEPPKTDVLDFFYQGVQSYEQMFAKQKESYENKANKLMAELEDQKAKDILSGMASEEVNKRYSDGYLALADSGKINKNLDAYRTMTKNSVAARGAVVGDVAEDAYLAYQTEMAKAGHSYVDRQRISEKFLNRYEGTPVGELLEKQIRPSLLQAQKEQANAEISRAVDNVAASAKMAIAEGTYTPDLVNQTVRAAFDPTQGNVPPLLDDENRLTLEAETHLGEFFFKAHAAPLIEDADPEIREALGIALKDEMNEQAQQVLLRKRQNDLAAAKAEEDRESIASLAFTMSEGESSFDNLTLAEGESVSHITKQEFLATTYSTAAKAVIVNDQNAAEFMAQAWGTDTQTSFFKQTVASALATDNPTAALASIAKSFPATAQQAHALGYTSELLDSQTWESISAPYRKKVNGFLMEAGAASAVRQMEDIIQLDPAAALEAMPQVHAHLSDLGQSLGVDMETLTAFGEMDSPAKEALRAAFVDIKKEVSRITGTGSGGMTGQEERFFQLGAIGLDSASAAQYDGFIVSNTKAGNAPVRTDHTAVGGVVSDRLAPSLGTTGDILSDASKLNTSLYRLNEDTVNAQNGAGVPNPKGAWSKTTELLTEIRDNGELALEYPDSARGAIHGSLVTEMSGLFPNRTIDLKSDKIGLALQERLGENSNEDLRVSTSDWLSKPENQEYAYAFYDQVDRQLFDSGVTSEPERRAGVRKIITSQVGEEGYLKVALGRVYGSNSEAREEGAFVVTKGRNIQDLNVNGLKRQLNLEMLIKERHGADTDDWLQAMLSLHTSESPIDSNEEIDKVLGDKTQRNTLNSSYFSLDTRFESAAVASWGADDSTLEDLYRQVSVTLKNDPAALSEFRLQYERRLINSDFPPALINGDLEAVTAHYSSAFSQTLAEFMQDYGMRNGEFVRFDEGNLDRETHAYLLSSKGIPGSVDRDTHRGKSVLMGDLDDWGANLTDQDSPWYSVSRYVIDDRHKVDLDSFEVGGRVLNVGKNVAVAHQMLRNVKIDFGDGRGEVSLVDGLMRTKDGEIDYEFVNRYVGFLEADIDSGAANSLQTNLHAMIKASGDKLKGDRNLLGLDSVDDLAMYIASTGDEDPVLIMDDNSPSGYSLAIPGIRPLPWAAPKSNYTGMTEGRTWPSPSGRTDADFDVTPYFNYFSR